MQLKSIAGREATVVLTGDELEFLCGTIRETLEALEGWEFHTRTGETRERAEELWMQLRSIFDKTTHQDGK
jgi:hypothetical protein